MRQRACKWQGKNFNMKRNFIILRRKDCYEIWGSLTTLCEAHGFSYNWLKKNKFPFVYKGISFIKVKFRDKIL